MVQNRRKCEPGQGFQSACSASGLVHLINALKLLANRQENGDGLLQNIVTCLGKGSRKGLTEGLREFIKRAFEVGYLNQGMETCKVRKPKVPEGCSEVTVRKNSDEC